MRDNAENAPESGAVYTCAFLYPQDFDGEAYTRLYSALRIEKLRNCPERLKPQYMAAELAYRAALRMAAEGGELLFAETAEEWCMQPYSYGRNGKPLLERGFISLSHTVGAAAASFSTAPVGVDVERERSLGARIAKRVLTEREYGAYLEAAAQEDFLLSCWTAKEALLKLTGEGLAGGMTGLELDPVHGVLSRLSDGRRFRIGHERLSLADGGSAVLSACAGAESSFKLAVFRNVEALTAFIGGGEC